MAFQSIQQFANKQTRQTKSQNHDFVSVTQVFREKIKACMITITLSEKLMESARLRKGDRVDLYFDQETSLWKVGLNKDGSYTVSGNASSPQGVVRFTHKPGMPNIADVKTPHKRLFADTEQLVINAGEVIFKLDESAELAEASESAVA
jgi:hypothetical protein